MEKNEKQRKEHELRELMVKILKQGVMRCLPEDSKNTEEKISEIIKKVDDTRLEKLIMISEAVARIDDVAMAKEEYLKEIIKVAMGRVEA